MNGQSPHPTPDTRHPGDSSPLFYHDWCLSCTADFGMVYGTAISPAAGPDAARVQQARQGGEGSHPGIAGNAVGKDNQPMQWYYAIDGEQKGPVDEDAFRKLIDRDVIRPDTLVWREGFGSWEPWRKIAAEDPAGVAETQSAVCVECGRRFLPEQMIRFGDSNVCAQCKPVFFQKMREGIAVSGTFLYGGFWIRGLALIVDGIIIFPVNVLINLMAGVMTGAPGPAHGMGMHVAAAGLPMLLNLALACAYDTWFVGRFAATPGKMLCGLRVVRPDGERVSYARALGRHFAEMLSAYILFIGYIMAAFDGEKRSLHDHICDTRVVRK